MKVAIIIGGEPRFREFFDDFLFNLKNYDQVDWFFYFWKTNPSVHPIDPYRRPVPLPWQNIPSVEWAINKINNYLPENHKVARLELGDYAGDEPLIELQFTSLYRADLLRQQYEKENGEYDLVIRARLDRSLHSPVDLLDIKNQINQEPNLMFTPNDSRHIYEGDGWKYGMNDQIAISSSKNMSVYTDLINHITDYVKVGMPRHAEALLNYHLVHNGVVLKEELPINYRDPGVYGKWEN
jgi:hypothetical protein